MPAKKDDRYRLIKGALGVGAVTLFLRGRQRRELARQARIMAKYNEETEATRIGTELARRMIERRYDPSLPPVDAQMIERARRK